MHEQRFGYKHDCDKCTPLGEWRHYDLYICQTDKEYTTTVIARYGSDGPQYASFPVDVLLSIQPREDGLMTEVQTACHIAYERSKHSE